MSRPRGPKRTWPRHCDHCGKAYEAAKPKSRYCGVECTRAASTYGRTYGQVEPRDVGRVKPLR